MDRPFAVYTSAICTGLLLGSAASAGAGAAPGSPNASTTAADLIPREVFFGNPDRASLNISPDGAHIAYLAPRDGVMNVWVQPVNDDGTLGAARAVTNSTNRPIRQYFWAGNAEQILYLQDTGGDENWRLYAVNVTGDADESDAIDLTPFDGVQARVVAVDQNHPDAILAGINNRMPQLHDVWRINTRTGERERIFENNEGWAGFLANSDFTIRGAIRMNQHGGLDLFLRPGDEAEFEHQISWDQEESANSGPLGFSRDGSMLYLLDSRNTDTAALFAMSFDDEGNAGDPQRIAHSDLADISGAMTHPETGRPQAVTYEYTRREIQILDPAVKPDLNYLEQVSRGDINVTGRSNDDRVWTVAYVVDDGPVRYYLYQRNLDGDRDTPGTATFLFTNRNALEGLELARMKPVVVNARDGLKLVSYLTLPAGVDAAGAGDPIPMVLLVHGGPWARDTWGYNSLHQWLANRGYAVLSVNFRGSTGFGKSFVNAGNREWAAKMHDDLIDAVNWAVNEGIADPDRVAIMGGSYGGYATLVGLTFTPDVFAAGVDIVGPSHIRTLLESIPPYWEPIKAMFETRVGSLDEPEYLDSISPLTYVDRIERPLLIGQGANDPRVKQPESEQIVKAMQDRDIPVTYVLFPDEGHGFARPVNNMAFWAVTEAFLAEHLGGNYEPIGDALEPSTAQVPEGAALVPGLAEAIGR